MNHEVQRRRGLTSVENSSTLVDRAAHVSEVSMADLACHATDEQPRCVIHKRVTVVPQFFHRGFELSIASQPAANGCFTSNTRSRIDSRAARFSTTPEYLKL
jgi:hypothetical protein